MKKFLKRTNTDSLHHIVDGKPVPGPHTGLTGDCTGLMGDCTGLMGDCTGLTGDCTGLTGDLELCEIDHSVTTNIEKLVKSGG